MITKITSFLQIPVSPILRMSVQRLTVLILENYWAVCFGVAPYIDRETHIFPECTNNRGLHMVSLQLNMSRTELALFWGHVEAGTHLDQTCPFMTHQKVHRVEVGVAALSYSDCIARDQNCFLSGLQPISVRETRIKTVLITCNTVRIG